MACDILTSRVKQGLLLFFFLMLGFDATALAAQASRPEDQRDAKQMIQLNKTTAPHGGGVNGEEAGKNHEFGFPLAQRRKPRIWEIPSGLVVSSDDEVRQKLTEIARQCGFAAVSASSVAEAGVRLLRYRVFVVVCEDRLADGEYDAVVRIAHQFAPGTPVIVVSPTGDWPEYLTATQAGVFDYLAYPPIPGELERIIQNALRSARRHRLEGTQAFHFPGARGEEPWASSQ